MKPIIIKVGNKEYPTFIDENGTQRFIANKVISYLVDEGIIDLNKVAKEFQMNKFKLREYAEFMMSTGYSVSGFSELHQFWCYKIENPLWELEGKN